MHTPLHVLLRADHGELKVDPRKNFTDARHFVEPVSADFFYFVWDLGEIDRILVLIGDDNALIRVNLRQLAHPALDKLLEVV